MLRHKRKIAFLASLLLPPLPASPSLKSIFWVTALHSLLSLKTLGPGRNNASLFTGARERAESCEHWSRGQGPVKGGVGRRRRGVAEEEGVHAIICDIFIWF